MTQMHRPIHDYVLFYFIVSRAPYGVCSSMWRIKHEWTERLAHGANGTGAALGAGRNETGRGVHNESSAYVIATVMRKDNQ